MELLGKGAISEEKPRALFFFQFEVAILDGCRALFGVFLQLNFVDQVEDWFGLFGVGGAWCECVHTVF